MTASRPFDFAKYKRPHEGPMQKLPHFRPAETDDGETPTENLSELLGRVSEKSTSQIDDLVGDFGRLREKLRTDGERIQRDIEEYKKLSQQVMATDEEHLRRRGESSSISRSAPRGPQE
jgi:hypothetical protein